MRKSKGSLLDFLSVMVTIIFMAVVSMVLFNLSELLITRMDMSQVTRKYILRMETKGFLDEADRNNLVQELQEIGVQNVDLSGSTMHPVAYGDTIFLCVKGSMAGKVLKNEGEWGSGFVQKQYVVEEKRMSTAKN